MKWWRQLRPSLPPYHLHLLILLCNLFFVGSELQRFWWIGGRRSGIHYLPTITVVNPFEHHHRNICTLYKYAASRFENSRTKKASLPANLIIVDPGLKGVSRAMVAVVYIAISVKNSITKVLIICEPSQQFTKCNTICPNIVQYSRNAYMHATIL